MCASFELHINLILRCFQTNISEMGMRFTKDEHTVYLEKLLSQHQVFIYDVLDYR